jgi:6-phosphogluconolactonase
MVLLQPFRRRTRVTDPTGALLYAANLESDNIAPFRVDQDVDTIKPTGQMVETGSPSCIFFGCA